jgi:hypothetical protein
MNHAVFVPAIMSVGLLFSIASLLDDLFRWGSRRARDRRVRFESAAVARTIVDPTAPLTEDETVQPPRLAYLLWGMVLLGAACYVAVGSMANYLRAGGYVSDIAWLLAVSLVLAAAVGFMGGVVAMVYLSWPARPAGTHGVLRRLPFVTPTSGAETHPSPATTFAIGLSAGAVLLLSLLVGSNDALTARIDEPLADWLVSQKGLTVLRHLDPLGRTDVALVLAALVGVAALRCRLLAAAYPAAVVLGGLSSLALKGVIDRPRPARSSLQGSVDSYRRRSCSPSVR